MKILLGTKNKIKKQALELALNKLGIKDYTIDTYKAVSNVRENPINNEIEEGARNRTKSLNDYCKNNNLEYDILISTEAGYKEDNNNYYLETYTCVEYRGKIYIGVGPKMPISKTMFQYVVNQNMMHELINKILGKTYDEGIIGFLTDGKIKRSNLEASSIINALSRALNIKITEEILDFDKFIISKKLELLEKEIANIKQEDINNHN